MAMKKEGISVCLAVIQVGDDPASSVYVGNKKKACAYVGIESLAYELPEETTEKELLNLVEDLFKSVFGIFLQDFLWRISGRIRACRRGSAAGCMTEAKARRRPKGP